MDKYEPFEKVRFFVVYSVADSQKVEDFATPSVRRGEFVQEPAASGAKKAAVAHHDFSKK